MTIISTFCVWSWKAKYKILPVARHFLPSCVKRLSETFVVVVDKIEWVWNNCEIDYMKMFCSK